MTSGASYQDTTQANREREFQRSATEINPQKGENEYENWFTNQKLTYDQTLEILSTQARRSQGHYDALVGGEREHRSELQRVSLQALQNAVETANMISKQAIRHQENTIETANLRGKDAVRHSQIATDRQWNKEPSEAAAETTELREVLNEPAIRAIQTALVSALGDVMAKMKETGE
jgi:hypothetical protein